MLGHEFRQTQTALISYYIDLQDNFSLDYETPLFGPPWQMPLELPVYEWCVVWVKRVFGIKDFEAARTVSLTCFYAAFPAFYLLLGRSGLVPAHRLVVLALLLCCPVYIFYSRAFLIDPMAFMFSVWFLAAFVESMIRRQWRWWLLCTLVGSIAALIKSLVFLVWLFPAASYGAWSLWRDWQENGTRRALTTTVWGVGVVVLPYTSLRWWVDRTDAIKENPVTEVFTSKMLTEGNFGTYSLAARLSAHTWEHMFIRWSEAFTYWWSAGTIWLFGIMFCRTQRWRILTAIVLFMFGQFAFPYAYTGQDYYFYTCAAFGVMGMGFVVVGIWEKSRWPIWLRFILAALPFAALVTPYWRGYRPMQQVESHGGFGMTAALDYLLPNESVVVIQGEDWAAIRPYYIKRRAFMIRNGMERNERYMTWGLDNLRNESVDALMVDLSLSQREEWVADVTSRLNLNSWPTLRDNRFEVYFSPILDHELREIPEVVNFHEVRLVDAPSTDEEWWEPVRNLLPGKARRLFPVVNRDVFRYRIGYGYGLGDVQGTPALNFHPDSDLWVDAPVGPGRTEWRYGLAPAAYEKDGDRTNGVLFGLYAENASKERRSLFERKLRPTTEVSDRGIQTSLIDYVLAEDETLVFASRPLDSYAFDWAFFYSAKVE